MVFTDFDEFFEYPKNRKGGVIVIGNPSDEILKKIQDFARQYYEMYHCHFVDWKNCDERIKRRINFDETTWYEPKSAFEEYR